MVVGRPDSHQYSHLGTYIVIPAEAGILYVTHGSPPSRRRLLLAETTVTEEAGIFLRVIARFVRERLRP